MLDNKNLWENALTEIELNVSSANFSTWFKNTYIAKQEDGIIHIGVPSAFVKEWLNNKYHKFILKSLREFNEHVRGLEYIVCKESVNNLNLAKKEKHSVNNSLSNEQLPLNDL